MYAPEHEEQPVQSFQVHFNAHVWTFDAHQLLHSAVLPVEQKEHPEQSGRVHFVVHTLDLGLHQLSHSAVAVVAVPEVVLEHGGHAAQHSTPPPSLSPFAHNYCTSAHNCRIN